MKKYLWLFLDLKIVATYLLTSAENSIAVCNLGYTRDSGNCVKCGSGGFYKDEKGPRACTECPPPRSATDPVDGATSVLACGM